MIDDLDRLHAGLAVSIVAAVRDDGAVPANL
jgi:hypothetical protein